MSLTQEQRDFFFEKGYVPYGALLDNATVELLRHEYDAEFEKAQRDNTFNNLSESYDKTLEEKKAAPVQMLQIMQMCERNIHFRKLLFNETILDAVECLIGPNIMLWHDQALWKPAHNGGPVTWHQDNAYWRLKPANLVSCWITLDDVTRENGAMQVAAGSHLKPVWHEEKAGDSVLYSVENHVDKSTVQVVDLPAGGAMFHHCQTLHYTDPNTTDRQRRAFAIHFCVPGTVSHDGTNLKAGWNHPVLRARV